MNESQGVLDIDQSSADWEVMAATGVKDPPRFPFKAQCLFFRKRLNTAHYLRLPGRFTVAPGSAARKLPHPNEAPELS